MAEGLWTNGRWRGSGSGLEGPGPSQCTAESLIPETQSLTTLWAAVGGAARPFVFRIRDGLWVCPPCGLEWVDAIPHVEDTEYYTPSSSASVLPPIPFHLWQ